MRVGIRHIRAVFCAALGLCLGLATAAHAQQREFYNGGFEQNDPQGPGTPSFQIYPNAQVNEWTDATGVIELWDSGFQGVTSYEGNVHAEMNANTNGVLYQEVCLVSGETLGWSFAHRARTGSQGPNPQTAILEIATGTGTIVQTLATQSSFKGNPWTVNTGATTFGASNPTGVYRVQFRATTSSSYGNFIDDLRLNIAAFAEFTAASVAEPEANTSNIPTITVDGRVETTTTIPVSVIGGTADGSDYTLTASVVTIPPGIYAAQAFPLPVVISDDFDDEADETIVFQIGTPSTNEIELASTACDSTVPQTTVTYTILNDDTTLDAVKTVEITDGAGRPAYAVPGNEAVYTIAVSNTGTEAVDADTLFLSDALPLEVEMFTGDFDGGGPVVGAVAFSETGSGLSWVPGTDLGYSDATAKPAQMSDCTYAPASTYDPNIRHICFAPSGTFASADPDPEFAVTFRTRIK